MRLAQAWIAGIATFILLYFFFDWVGHSIGVPVLLKLGYTKYYSDRYGDYEVDREFTSYGLFSVLITWMLSIRAGMTVNARSIDADVSSEGNLQFSCWLLAFSILTVLMAILDIAFKQFDSSLSGLLKLVFQVSITLGVWWAIKTFYQQRLEKLKRGDSDD